MLETEILAGALAVWDFLFFPDTRTIAGGLISSSATVNSDWTKLISATIFKLSTLWRNYHR